MKGTTPKSRRDFLQKFGAGLAVGLTLPAWAESHELKAPADFADESYWEMVKQQFAVPPDKLMVNAANLCPPPLFVIDRIAQYHSRMARDVSFQSRSQYGELKNQALEMMADFIGAQVSECGITRNTSEANNIVVSGLDLKKNEEVIVWDQNHPSINSALEQRSKRMGFKVKTVSVPQSPRTTGELITPFKEAMTSKTRLVCFSHISNVTGIRMPVKELCAAARENGTLSHVDGAQGLGYVNLDVHDLGCDFYTASTHKWLMGPFENGLLYVRKEVLDQIWPLIISAGWNEENSNTTDTKLCILGQRNVAETAALPEIFKFHNTIGKDNVESRVDELNSHLRKLLADNVKGVSFVTPADKSLNANITIFNLEGKEGREVFNKLYSDHGIAGAPTGGVRISPTINSTLKDMERIVDAIQSV